MSAYLKESNALTNVVAELLSRIDPKGEIVALSDQIAEQLSKLPKNDEVTYSFATALALYKVFGYEVSLQDIAKRSVRVLADTLVEKNGGAIKQDMLTPEESDKYRVEGAARSPAFAEILVSGSEEEKVIATQVYAALSKIDPKVKSGVLGLQVESTARIPEKRVHQIVRLIAKDLAPSLRAASVVE